MRIIIIALICLFVISVVYAEPSIYRDMPSEIEENTILEVKITINPNSEEKFDLAEIIPNGWEIETWNVNSDLDVSYENREFKGRVVNHWGFNSVSEKVELKYTLTVEDYGNFDFQTILIYPGGIYEESNELKVNEEKNDLKPSPITGMLVGTHMEVLEEELNINSNIFSNLKESISSIQY